MEVAHIEDISSNYYDYRKQALLWAQRLSGLIWTDYNPHDPGVTILEVLSYVLTELDYKLDFSLEEILLSSEKEENFKLEDNALFLAENIFHTAPVTLSDFRVLLIDQIHGVVNAWVGVENAEEGTFNLIIQLSSNIDAEAAKKQVHELFNTYSAFGWSLNKVRIIEKKNARLHGNFYFESEHSAEKLMAMVMYEFNERLVNRQPTSHTPANLAAEGMPLERIFEGPKMHRGIFLKEDLKPFHDQLNLHVIKGELSRLEGVEMLSDFKIGIDGKHYHKLLSIKDHLPYLEPSEVHQIKVYKDNKPAELNEEEVAYQYHKMHQANRRNYALSGQRHPSFQFARGSRNRNIAVFHRLLQEFPTIYKIISNGTEWSERFENEQFRSLLLPFEQFLANSMKQLAETATFFSIDSPHSGYDQQVVHDPKRPLREEIVHTIDFRKRRNQMLNHLLSRFDYSIHTDLPDLYYGDHPESLAQRIKCKEMLLRDLPDISAHKGSMDTKHPNGTSYLEYEILLRLWIDDLPNRPLHQAVSDWGIDVTRLDDEGNLKVKEYLEELFERNFSEKDRRFYLFSDRPLEELLKAGTIRNHYSVSKLKEEERYGLFLSLGDTQLKNLIHKSKSRKALLRSINGWIEQFYEINRKSEGFYIIDNAKVQAEALHAWHTVTFVFAAWNKRFQSKSFQHNVEEMVIDCMPAHLRIQFAWLSHPEMKVFEQHYPIKPSINQTEEVWPEELITLLQEKLPKQGGKPS